MTAQVPPLPTVSSRTLQAAEPSTPLHAFTQLNDDLEALKTREEAGSRLEKQVLREMYASDLGGKKNKKRKSGGSAGDAEFRKRMRAASLVAAEVSNINAEEWFEHTKVDGKTHEIERYHEDSRIEEEEGRGKEKEAKVEEEVNGVCGAKIGQQAKEAGDGVGAEEDRGYADEPKEEHKTLFAALGIDGKKFRMAPRRLKAQDVWAI